MKTNISKRIMSLLLAVFMLTCSRITALAAEAPAEDVIEMTAVNNEASVASDEVYYGNVWLNPGNYSKETYFQVSCPLRDTFYCTLELEASGKNSNATLYVEYPNGNTRLLPVTLNSSNKPVYKFSLYYTNSGTVYKIHYTGYTDTGMRLMCWMYKDKPADYDDYN